MPELPVCLLSDTVVFPGTTVTLHVHDRLHRELVSHALKHRHGRFVIACGSGSAFSDGRPSLPRHGTCVQILSHDLQPDGSITLKVSGQKRIMNQLTREQRITDSRGHVHNLLFVRNEPAPLQRVDPNEEQLTAWDATEVFLRYTKTFYSREACLQVDDSLPEDPADLAAFFCTNLSVGAATRQVLLDAGSVSDCLRMVQLLTASSLAARANAASGRAAG